MNQGFLLYKRVSEPEEKKNNAEYTQETVGWPWMSIGLPVVYFALSLAFDSQTRLAKS